MGIKADKIKNIHVKQSNGQYSTIPLSGGGYATPQMYGAKGDGVTDDTEAFKKAFDSGQKIIIPQASYNLSQFIWTDDSVVLIDLGNYQSGTGKLIISKTLTDGPVYERVIQEFNPYLNPVTNSTTTLFNTDVYQSNDYKINSNGQIVYSNGQPVQAGTVGGLIHRRLQGACYVKEHDIFAFGFCQVNNNVNRALIVFYRLTNNNTFEYKGHGIVKYGGHLNSMCCRTQQETYTENNQTKKRNVACIYASCAAEGSRNLPPTPTDGSTNIQKYGGGRIQLARIPINVLQQPDENGENDLYGIPDEFDQNELIQSNFATVKYKEDQTMDYGNYNDIEDEILYHSITYFCGINSDEISQNRTLMRMTYDDDNDIFYLEYSKIRYDKNGNVESPNHYYLKPFKLERNHWIECKQGKFTYTRNGQEYTIYEGVAGIDKARTEALQSFPIFSDSDIQELAVDSKYVFDGQGPLVIDGQLVHVCYVSKQVKHLGWYDSGILMMQYNYKTQGLKKLYKIPCQIAEYEPQCLVKGKGGRIYLINDIGQSGTAANKMIRVTQLVLNPKVSAISGSPFTDPKRLDMNYLIYKGFKTESSSTQNAIDLNFITEPGAYVFRGDFSDSEITTTEAQYDNIRILNGPGVKSYVFSLYVFSFALTARLQVFISKHGTIFVRNADIKTNGAIEWTSWRQLVETGRKEAGRSGTWYGTGFMRSTTEVDFTIPFPTPILSETRNTTPTIDNIIALNIRQNGKNSNCLTANNNATNINSVTTAVNAWGYNTKVTLKTAPTSFEVGPVGVQINFRLIF